LVEGVQLLEGIHAEANAALQNVCNGDHVYGLACPACDETTGFDWIGNPDIRQHLVPVF
jgi:hypothetical protein